MRTSRSKPTMDERYIAQRGREAFEQKMMRQKIGLLKINFFIEHGIRLANERIKALRTPRVSFKSTALAVRKALLNH